MPRAPMFALMKGKYLADSRSEMLEAMAESPEADKNHGLRSLAALTEAFIELEARVTRAETVRIQTEPEESYPTETGPTEP